MDAELQGIWDAITLIITFAKNPTHALTSVTRSGGGSTQVPGNWVSRFQAQRRVCPYRLRKPVLR